MSLSRELYEEELQTPCLSCGKPIQRLGQYFAIIKRIKCDHCQQTQLITYDEKIRIWSRHLGLASWRGQ